LKQTGGRVKLREDAIMIELSGSAVRYRAVVPAEHIRG
jgi:hypothetical protein